MFTLVRQYEDDQKVALHQFHAPGIEPDTRISFPPRVRRGHDARIALEGAKEKRLRQQNSWVNFGSGSSPSV